MAAEVKASPVRSWRRRDGLLQFAKDVTSQNGEDGIIAAIFACLDQHVSKETRWCVDVGAWDGAHLSNTHSLLVGESPRRWKGALIEADAARYQDLKALHAPLGNFAIESFASCTDPSRSIESLLEKEATSVPLQIDLISIDVDGCDYWLWHDFLASSFTASVVVVEFNPSMPHDVRARRRKKRAFDAREGTNAP